MIGKALTKIRKKIMGKDKKKVEMLKVKPTIKGKPVGEDVKPGTEIPKMSMGGGVFIPKGQKDFQVKKQYSRIR
jgi:hypothetical protein